MKPVLAHVHAKGHISVAQMDDLYLQGCSYEDCIRNVIETTLLLEKLGFTVHPVKSVLVPTQEIVVLGFVLNSLTMTVMLTKEKAVNFKAVLCALITRPKGNHSTSGTGDWEISGQLSWGYAWAYIL